jgi:hypothetical protein
MNDDDDINYDDDDDDVAFQGCHPFFCPRNMFNDAVHINQIDCDFEKQDK